MFSLIHVVRMKYLTAVAAVVFRKMSLCTSMTDNLELKSCSTLLWSVQPLLGFYQCHDCVQPLLQLCVRAFQNLNYLCITFTTP